MIKLSKSHSNLSHKIQESIVKNDSMILIIRNNMFPYEDSQGSKKRRTSRPCRPPGAKWNCGWEMVLKFPAFIELLQRIPLNKNPSANSDPKKMEFDSGILKNDIFSLFGQLFLVLEQSL